MALLPPLLATSAAAACSAACSASALSAAATTAAATAAVATAACRCYCCCCYCCMSLLNCCCYDCAASPEPGKSFVACNSFQVGITLSKVPLFIDWVEGGKNKKTRRLGNRKPYELPVCIYLFILPSTQRRVSPTTQ